MQELTECVNNILAWLEGHVGYNVLLWMAIGWCIGAYLDLISQIEELEKRNHD